MTPNSLSDPLWHRIVLHLPVLTTLLSLLFATVLFRRYSRRGGGPHLLWWAIGMLTYGIGTFTESWTTIVGWHPAIFKLWYVTGAFLGGYPLAQGSIYLLSNRRFADWSARIVSSLIVVAALLVAISPLDVGAAEPHRLSGRVLEWRWLRAFSPFINLYSLAFLAGGAAVSAARYRRESALRNRYVGNILIAVGAVLPGIGGTFTRFGYVEMLYMTELLGLSLIYAGYRRCISSPAPAVASHPAAVTAATLLLTLVGSGVGVAQDSATANSSAPDKKEEQPAASYFDSTTVTATGSERPVFQVATPVTVVDKAEIERVEPQNAADLLRDQPGVDVNGVGPNQARPVIRGQRGLRVLFMEDGLRLNNARRQTDFGEITGLVDLDSIDAVEVVRGPASVLYGSDAIGGVLNLITGRPHLDGDRRFGGSVDYRYGSAQESGRIGATVMGVNGTFDYQIGAMNRRSNDYDAPSGRFGAVRLAKDATVLDTGLDDHSFWGSVGYQLDDSNSLRLRYNRYRAGQTGFGFVDPQDYAPAEDRIRIFYPYQDFDRVTATYQGSALELAIADSADFKLYHQSNQRQLANDIVSRDAAFGPFFVVDIDTLGTTHLDTNGVRFEAIKSAAPDHLLTWGLEAFRDDSDNTDFSHTFVGFRFPFPPFEVAFVDATDTVANAPNATNSSWGAFAQDEWSVSDRVRVSGGLRYQRVSTKADATPGWDISGLDFHDDAVVGSVTATWQLLPELNLLTSYGTAFRAPNIIERLFNGVTPEGNGYQILNPDLSSEKSRNIDVGLKYRRRDAYMELVAFRTDIRDGIIQYFLTDAEIAALPPEIRSAIETAGISDVVQQRNADKLRYKGVELALGYRAPVGITVGGNYTHLRADRIDSTNPPTGDTYGDKFVAYVRYEPDRRPLWIEYRLRHNASTDANLDPNQPIPPVGRTLPGFTVHTLAAGGTVYRHGRFEHEVRVAIENLTDELYAEFSNASFFRPEPGRSFNASYRLKF